MSVVVFPDIQFLVMHLQNFSMYIYLFILKLVFTILHSYTLPSTPK